MPDSAAGKTTRTVDLKLRCAQAERALAQRLRHRAHRVLGDRGDGRDDQEAHDDAGGERVEDLDVAAPKRPRRISGVKNVSAK